MSSLHQEGTQALALGHSLREPLEPVQHLPGDEALRVCSLNRVGTGRRVIPAR